jgi:hypothetical protein
MTSHARALIVAVIAIVALAVPPAGAAGHVLVDLGSGEITVDGDNSADTLTATITLETIAIENTSGTVGSSTCDVDATTALCAPRPAIIANLNGGTDSFAPAAGTTSTVQYVLFGGEDADDLSGGPGADELHGEGGGDTLRAQGGGIDQVTCGPGTDLVFADDADTVAADCEHVNPGSPPQDVDPPTPPIDTACVAANERLAKAKAKLKKLRKQDAPKAKIQKAKRKLKKAKAAVAAEC